MRIAGIVLVALGLVVVGVVLAVRGPLTAASSGPPAPPPDVASPPAALDRTSGLPAPRPADDPVWDALAQCESGGDWAIDTHNGLYGGVQLDASTWRKYGGDTYAPLPHQATREQQILVAERVRSTEGFSTWSSCAAELGLG